MNRHRRALAAALALAPLAGPLCALAQQPGVNYSVLKPEQPVDAQGGRIEVAEFFWYGCIHCYTLEPALEAWQKGLAPDVQFRRIPAVFNDRWALDAAIYYAFEALGLLERLHRPLYDAIHKDRLRTDDKAAFEQWLQKQGADAKKVIETVRSFGVQSKVKRAQQLTVAYRIDGTPALAVHGRYTVSPEQGGTQQGMLKTVDHLVELTRRALAKK